MRFCRSAILWLFLCGVCVVGPSLAPHPKAQSVEMHDGKGMVLPSTDRILHQLKLSDGRELVVVRRAITPVSAMDDLFPPNFFRKGTNVATGIFEIELELRFPNSPALRLWSQRRVVYAEVPEDADDDRVLAMSVVSHRVVLVMANRGGVILYDIPFVPFLQGGPPRVAGLSSVHCSLLAAAIPLKDGRFSANLKYDERDDALEIHVTDFMDTTKLHTVWRQKGKGEWAFDLQKRWEEKVPATAP